MKPIAFAVFSFFSFLIFPVGARAQTWTQTAANTNYAWTFVASSADGTKLAATVGEGAAEGIYVSTNSGLTWALSYASSAPWGAIVSSADGTKLAAMGNSVYLSTNSGATWKQTSMQGSLLSLSADGNVLIDAVVGGDIYVSTNFGATAVTSPSSGHWGSVVCSANGREIAGLISQDDDPVIVSTNYGITWANAQSIVGQPGGTLASTADGSKLMLSTIGRLYISTNWGVTWSTTNSTGTEIVCSADGSTLLTFSAAAGNANNGIYTSTNLGVSWISNSVPPEPWSSAACSADGKKIVAIASNGPYVPSTNGVWVSQTPASPQLKLSSSSNGLNLSWIVPSTNMALEQSPDLFNWTTLTNAPLLDYTNLQEQLTLSPTNSYSFFRLISQ